MAVVQQKNLRSGNCLVEVDCVGECMEVLQKIVLAYVMVHLLKTSVVFVGSGPAGALIVMALPCRSDCAGECGGSATEDCAGGNGSSVEDERGVCDGSGPADLIVMATVYEVVVLAW